MSDKPETYVPEFATAEDVCVHEIRPEIAKTSGTVIGGVMKLRVMGHLMGNDHASEELFCLITSVPNAAVFASKILEESGKVDSFTGFITAMALQREMQDAAEREQSAPQVPAEPEPDPLEMLAAIFGGDMGGMVKPLDDEQDVTGEKPKGFARNATEDDPVRLIDLGTNPGGRPTFAPIDNRDDYPNIGGYL